MMLHACCVRHHAAASPWLPMLQVVIALSFPRDSRTALELGILGASRAPSHAEELRSNASSVFSITRFVSARELSPFKKAWKSSALSSMPNARSKAVRGFTSSSSGLPSPGRRKTALVWHLSLQVLRQLQQLLANPGWWDNPPGMLPQEYRACLMRPLFRGIGRKLHKPLLHRSPNSQRRRPAPDN